MKVRRDSVGDNLLHALVWMFTPALFFSKCRKWNAASIQKMWMFVVSCWASVEVLPRLVFDFADHIRSFSGNVRVIFSKMSSSCSTLCWQSSNCRVNYHQGLGSRFTFIMYVCMNKYNCPSKKVGAMCKTMVDITFYMLFIKEIIRVCGCTLCLQGLKNWFLFCYQVRPLQPCHARSAPFRPGRPTTPRRLWKGTMSAVACLSIPQVVAEEGLATVPPRTAMAWAETTTRATVMATITLQEVRLMFWRWRGITPTLKRAPTRIATLEGAPSPAPIPASTHLCIHLTLVKSACLRATEGRCTAFPQTWWTSLRNRCPSIPMGSTHCSTNAPPVGVLSNAARAPHASATWSTLCSDSLPNPIPWKHLPNGSSTAREETTEVRGGVDTGVEGRMATIQATSPVLPGGTSHESVARVETRGTSRADVTAAGQRAGGALMTIWTATAAS